MLIAGGTSWLGTSFTVRTYGQRVLGVSEVKSMRFVIFSAGVIASIAWMGISPVDAAPSMPGISSTNIQVADVEKVGWRGIVRLTNHEQADHDPSRTLTLRVDAIPRVQQRGSV